MLNPFMENAPLVNGMGVKVEEDYMAASQDHYHQMHYGQQQAPPPPPPPPPPPSSAHHPGYPGPRDFLHIRRDVADYHHHGHHHHHHHHQHGGAGGTAVGRPASCSVTSVKDQLSPSPSYDESTGGGGGGGGGGDGGERSGGSSGGGPVGFLFFRPRALLKNRTAGRPASQPRTCACVCTGNSGGGGS